MLNESEHELSGDQTIANSSTGYLVFNGRPDNETAQPLTFSKTLRTTSGPLQRAKPSTLYAKQVLDAKSARLERWQFPVNGVNDLVSIEVWVPQLG